MFVITSTRMAFAATLIAGGLAATALSPTPAEARGGDQATCQAAFNRNKAAIQAAAAKPGGKATIQRIMARAGCPNVSTNITGKPPGSGGSAARFHFECHLIYPPPGWGIKCSWGNSSAM